MKTAASTDGGDPIEETLKFGENDVLPKALSSCVAAALTYHRDRRAARHASR